MREYDRIADWYSSARSEESGVRETEALASSIPPGSLVLDLGCGNGIPVTRALIRAGHRVIGLDSSAAMLERFRKNDPETPAVRGDVRACPFTDGIFDAAVAWGVLFHLGLQDQIKAIAEISRVVKTGAPFLFTSGKDEDLKGQESVMNGITFRYFSFSAENYRRVLAEQGFALSSVHDDNSGNTSYLALKTE